MKIDFITDETPYTGENNFYYYFYKIVCNYTNEYYYGVHHTKNINDGYYGSGKKLHKLYKLYGDINLNFKKYILKFFDNEEDMYNYEKHIVNCDLLKDIKCLNSVLGGKQVVTSSKNIKMYYKEKNILVNEEYKNIFELCGWKQGISPYSITIYVHNDIESIKIKKIELEKYITQGYKKGKLDIDIPIFINNGNIEIRINKNNLNKYLENNWNIGRLIDISKEKNPSYNKVWIFKNNIRKYIDKSELSKYLENGWKHIFYNENNERCKNKIWINNGIYNLRIDKDKLNNYPNFIKGRINYKRRITEKNSIKTIWINNQIISKRINIKDKEKYLSEGWYLGRYKFNKTNLNKSNIGKIWINKDNINKRIFNEDKNMFLNDGWKLGKLNQNIKMKNGNIIP